MSVNNDALLLALGLDGYAVVDGLVTATTATAPRLNGNVNRFVAIGTGDAAVLPSLYDAPTRSLIWVINDTAAVIQVRPFTGEMMGGTVDETLLLPTGTAALFIPVQPARIGKGGGVAPGATYVNNWRPASIA